MRIAVALALLASVVGAGPAAAIPPPGAPSCPVFPADNVWHADVGTLPVHARSAAWLSSMGGPTRLLHPDFGPSGMTVPYGIPYNIVSSTHQKVSVAFEYADESDAGPYPFGSDITIEGGSDRHAIMIDKDTCTLYELFAAEYSSNGSTAGSGAIFNLNSNALRPAGWTSADAAGLPVFAGLLRRDEVLAGNVDHAIRVTASRTDRSYVWPARHQAGYASDPNLPPMGARFRLKASFDVSGYRSDTQTVLRAFKKHGLILADNGSNWYFQGTAEDGWNEDFLDELKSIPAGAFEAVDASSLMIDPNSAQMRLGLNSTVVSAPLVVSNASATARFVVSWRNQVTDAVFDVDWIERVRDASGRWVWRPWQRWLTGTTLKAAEFRGTPGHTYWFRARGRTASETGVFSASARSIVPLDDRSTSISYGGGWINYVQSYAYGGTLRGSSIAGAAASITTDAGGFVVTGQRCPTCGKVAIYLDGRLLTTVDTYASTTQHRRVLFGKLWSQIGRHTLRLVVAPSSGRRVYLDSIGPAH